VNKNKKKRERKQADKTALELELYNRKATVRETGFLLIYKSIK
jgi:hypothetical protein